MLIGMVVLLGYLFYCVMDMKLYNPICVASEGATSFSGNWIFCNKRWYQIETALFLETPLLIIYIIVNRWISSVIKKNEFQMLSKLHLCVVRHSGTFDFHWTKWYFVHILISFTIIIYLTISCRSLWGQDLV